MGDLSRGSGEGQRGTGPGLRGGRGRRVQSEGTACGHRSGWPWPWPRPVTSAHRHGPFAARRSPGPVCGSVAWTRNETQS